MKKIKFFAVLLFVTLITSKTFSQIAPPKDTFNKNGNWHFLLEPLVGFHIGVIDENVWYKSNGDTHRLSLLEWEKSHTTFFGGRFAFGWKGLCCTLWGKGFLPGTCGVMKDSDWLQDYAYKTGNAGVKTNYSTSKNILNSSCNTGVELSVKFYPSSHFSIAPQVSCQWFFSDFSAIGGTAYYGKPLPNNPYSYYAYDDSSHNQVYDFGSDTVVDYSRVEFYVWTGVKIQFLPNSRLTISLSTDFSPYIYFVSQDYHPLRTDLDYKYFTDVVSEPFAAVKGNIAVSFQMTKHISVALDFTAMTTRELHGREFLSNSKKNYKVFEAKDSNVGGTARYLEWTLAVGIAW